MGSILISAGQPAERWVVRGIALGGKIRLPQSDNTIDFHPFRSSYILRNRSPRINAQTRNSSYERESQHVSLWGRHVILICGLKILSVFKIIILLFIAISGMYSLLFVRIPNISADRLGCPLW